MDMDMDTDTFSSPPPVPFRAPSRATSHHRRNSSMGAISSNVFEPFPPVSDEHDIGSDNVEETEPFATFDPRRFTPTLHANLVSEILSLRRELESKNHEIIKLETSLDESQNDNELLNEDLTKATKENRSLKKQMQLLEGGTLSAITEISKERDEAVENITEVRKRLEQSQKKLKAKEDEVERSHSLWERDRENWDTERRNWERKVHVVENRLKTILNEVAAAQAAGNFRKVKDIDEDPSKDNSTTMDSASVRSSSAFDRRRTSTSSASTYDGEPLNSGRFSSMSYANGTGIKGDIFNLADELAQDEDGEEENDDDEDYMEDIMEEISDMRPHSVASHSSLNTALKARRILGLAAAVTIGSKDETHLEGATPVISGPDVKQERQYRDVGVQFTPPQSPLLVSSDVGVVDASDSGSQSPAPEMRDAAVETVHVEKNTISCQTGYVVIYEAIPDLVEAKAQIVSVATQTEPETEAVESTPSTSAEDVQAASENNRIVPTIAIIPPGSEPATPRSSLVLPPHTKSVSCQTESEQFYDTRSVGMQTEAIQVDPRPFKIPASLLPSAILDKSDNNDVESMSMPFISPPPRSPHRPLTKFTTSKDKEKAKKTSTQPEVVQAYPGNNDNGPLAEDENSDIRRPLRSSSLFAGFDDTNDSGTLDSPSELPDVFSDDDILHRPMASYTLRSGRMVTRSGLSNDTLREEDEEFDIDLPSTERNFQNAGRKTVANSRAPPSGIKQPDIRRSTLISNGAVAHQRSRPRSPSDPSIDSESTGAARPPFPVPVRLSSRNVSTTTRSESNHSPTPYSDGGSSINTRRTSRRLTRQPTLRKARSATGMQKMQQERAGSRSPPPPSASEMSNSSYAPDSPQLPPLPPMPINDAVIYRPKRATRPVPASRPGSIFSQGRSYSVEEPAPDHVQSTNVVDAIAQTMVGEWMFKYVRRRKSFGMSDHKDTFENGKNSEEVSSNITNSGVRHKRWVWLAPYERAVMWSSKQPTSGPALLGKNGRKLTIQSVLDVKDDSPLPKGSNIQAPFNRSILILTPQRALKFTAMSLDRHYVWLTALSFLSHNSIGIGDLPTIPPPIPLEDFTTHPPTASLRRNPIRDSIRVAKGKPRPQPSKRSFTDSSAHNPEFSVAGGGGFDLEPIMDAADPPTVPRYAGHTRKRSNTGPKVPLSAAFRSFSSHATLPSNYSAVTAASSDIYATSSVGIAPGLMSGRSSVSHRTSEASGPSSTLNGYPFDPMSTMRMEAFIERVDHPRSRASNLMGHSRHARASRKRDIAHDFDVPRSEDGSESYYRNDDLFRGF